MRHPGAATLKPSYYNHYTDTADPERYVIFIKFWGSIAVADTLLLDESVIRELDVISVMRFFADAYTIAHYSHAIASSTRSKSSTGIFKTMP